jgi:hypothetical protein
LIIDLPPLKNVFTNLLISWWYRLFFLATLQSVKTRPSQATAVGSGLYGFTWPIFFVRCVGHSGYPYFHDKFTEGVIDQHGPQDTKWRKVDKKKNTPGGLILEGPNLYIKGHENEYGPHGYMTLEFDGARLNEIVHAPDSSVVYERELV